MSEPPTQHLGQHPAEIKSSQLKVWDRKLRASENGRHHSNASAGFGLYLNKISGVPLSQLLLLRWHHPFGPLAQWAKSNQSRAEVISAAADQLRRKLWSAAKQNQLADAGRIVQQPPSSRDRLLTHPRCHSKFKGTIGVPLWYNLLIGFLLFSLK